MTDYASGKMNNDGQADYTSGKTIQAGYMVTVETWENDGDHYKTKELQGLGKEDVALVLEVCNYFRTNGGDIKPWEEINKAVREIFEKHQCVTTGLLGNLLMDVNDEDDFHDHLYEIIGSPVEDYGCYGDGQNYYRNVDTVKVFHTPEDIFLEDVTKEFRN